MKIKKNSNVFIAQQEVKEASLGVGGIIAGIIVFLVLIVLVVLFMLYR